MAEIVNTTYNDDSIQTLEWNEHIRRRAGMYIGRLGNGDRQGDGIYVLLKEIVDNSIDEFSMGFGKRIDITIEDKTVTVRDYGRGIPLNKVVDATSKLNTGGKFDDTNFKKSVGMNGVGTKAVNAMSVDFYVASYREGKCSYAHFSRASSRRAPSFLPTRRTAPSSVSPQTRKCSTTSPSTWNLWRAWSRTTPTLRKASPSTSTA